jgi:hypothetical protein
MYDLLLVIEAASPLLSVREYQFPCTAASLRGDGLTAL